METINNRLVEVFGRVNAYILFAVGAVALIITIGHLMDYQQAADAREFVAAPGSWLWAVASEKVNNELIKTIITGLFSAIMIHSAFLVKKASVK